MKLSKAQNEYIKAERTKMDHREKDLRSFGEDLWKNHKLSVELGQIHWRRGLFNFMIELHNVEIAAEKEAQKELEKQIEEEFKDGAVK
jgi:hypothetical protein